MRHIPGELTACTKCGEMKPWTAEYFVSNQSRTAVVVQPCKKCNARYATEYYAAHKAEVIAQKTEYNAIHKTERATYGVAYNIAHKVEKAAYNAEYLATHRMENIARGARREARKRGLPDVYTSADFRRAKVIFNYRCAYCGKTPKATCHTDWTLHQDHYIPLADLEHCPGTVPTNIVPACLRCNLSKHDNDPHEWIVFKFGVRKAKKIEARIQAFFEAERAREQTR